MIRVGKGIDIHQIVKAENGKLPICGVWIEDGFNVIAHSDGDVGLHALCDALLGSVALGDIGEHFPPSDAKWKDCDSLILLDHVYKLVKEKNGNIVNIDMTIVAERPKIKPHKMLMRETIAKALGISIDDINIKATTSEKMGFTGRLEGIYAEAICLIKISDRVTK